MEEKIEPKGKPSITALSVATALQRMLAQGYAYLFSKNELELITYITNEGITPLSALTMNGLFARGLSAMPYSAQTMFFDMAVDEYYDEYIMLRKFMVKERINSAINEGAKQIVFLSGGYDIRPFISAQEHPGVQFYELDRGITRETKLKAMNTAPYEKLGFNEIKINELSEKATQINNNLFYLECDFSTDDPSEVLEKYGFSKEFKSLIIGEGLTMYLDESENNNVLKCAHSLMDNPESECLLGYTMSPGNESSLAVVARGKSSEQYKFALAPKYVPVFAASSALDIIAKQDITDMFVSLGDEVSIEFFKDPESKKGRECYYLMKKKGMEVEHTKTIEEVPDMNIVIPRNPHMEQAKQEDQSGCLQM